MFWHVVPRMRVLYFYQPNLPFSFQIKEFGQTSDIICERVVGIIAHRAVARQREIKPAHDLMVGLGNRYPMQLLKSAVQSC